MKNFIKALFILLKYENPINPFHCEHDILYICVLLKLYLLFAPIDRDLRLDPV